MHITYFANSHDSLLSALDFCKLVKNCLRTSIIIANEETFRYYCKHQHLKINTQIIHVDPLHISITNTPIPTGQVTAVQNATIKSKKEFFPRANIKNYAKKNTIVSAVNNVKHKKAQLKKWEKILLSLNPDLLLFKYITPGTHAPILNTAAKNNKIKTALFTNSSTHTVNTLILALKSQKKHIVSGIFFSIFAKFFPRWIYKHQGQNICRLPLPIAFAEEFLHLSQHNPWDQVSGANVDAIMVESFSMAEAIKKQNKNAQVFTTGSYALDVLYESTKYQQQIRTEFNIPSDRKVLVCSIPPNDRFPRRSPPEFPTLQSLLDFWLGAIHAHDFWTVLLTPHPRCTHNIKIRNNRTILINKRALDLIPIADLYLSVGSSTLRWAKANGVPTINFDCLASGDEQHLGNNGHLYCATTQDFLYLIKNISQDATLNSLTEQAKTHARAWGQVDGMSSKRTLEACKFIMAQQ